MKTKSTELTLDAFRERFSNEANCLEFLFNIRLKKEEEDNKGCYKCGWPMDELYRPIHNTKKFGCLNPACLTKISPMAGTIFENSHVSLSKWFMLIIEMLCSKNNISAKEIEYRLKISYKTSLKIKRKIQNLMLSQLDFKFDKAPVQIDGGYISTGTKGLGRHHKFKTGRGSERMTGILTIIEEGINGRAKSFVVTDEDSDTILPIILDNVNRNVKVRTDGWHGYRSLKKLGYDWTHVVHRKQFVNGEASTNLNEGYFSRFKRGVKGTHISISEGKLPLMLAESDWKYCHRNESLMEKFAALLDCMAPILSHIKRPVYKLAA